MTEQASPAEYGGHRCQVPSVLGFHTEDEVLVPLSDGEHYVRFTNFGVTRERLDSLAGLRLSDKAILDYHDKLVLAVMMGRAVYAGVACPECYRPLPRRWDRMPSIVARGGRVCRCLHGETEPILEEPGALQMVAFRGSNIITPRNVALEVSD